MRNYLSQFHISHSTFLIREMTQLSHLAQTMSIRSKGDVKPHGRLVLVSCRPHSLSTPSLSNSSSTSGLQGAYAPGDLILRQASRLDAFSGYPIRT